MSNKETPLQKIKVALLTYSNGKILPIERMLEGIGLSEQIITVGGLLTDNEAINAELAIAIMTSGHSVNEYAKHIAMLKTEKKIPVVLAMVPHEFHTEVVSNISSITADQVVFYPLPSDEFGRIIITLINFIRENIHVRKRPGALKKNQQMLGQILVGNNTITPGQLNKALDYQKKTDGRLGELLVLLGFISEEQRIQSLAHQLGIEVAKARQFASADLAIVSLIPEHVARRFTCIALEKAENQLIVAMTDVLDLQCLDMLRDITGMVIVPILGAVEDIKISLNHYYTDISSQKDATNLIADLTDDVEYVEQSSEDLSIEEAAAAGAELGIVKLVNMLLANAIRDRASDIHIEPMENSLTIRYRIDGELRKVMSPPKRSHQAMVTRIKILSNLDIAERRLPQDGRMVAKVGVREVDIRVSILPTIFGEKAVLRILDKEAFEKNVSTIGFTPTDQEIFHKNVTKPYGMVIVTGPTGSGKSTTLYSAIQQIKSVTSNIITVEDPVEFHMESINQVQVNNKTGLTFANALRSILRQDPDVILIGEIRDLETADIAIKMALTGHLVFSTLHTNDASSTIARFTDIGIPPLLLASSLNLIVAQRLVRTICSKCKKEYKPTTEMLDSLNLKGEDSTSFFMGEGCVNCNGTGYSGRTGIFELLSASRDIRTLILKSAGTMEIQKQAEREGMKTLRRAGIEMAQRGITTIEQVIAVTTEI